MTENDKPNSTGNDPEPAGGVPGGSPEPRTPDGGTGGDPVRGEQTGNDETGTDAAGGGQPGVPGDRDRRRGRVSFQDAGTTPVRKPSVGEQRARQAALRAERDERRAEMEELERKRKLRRRILIGTGVTVGVVAVVAVIYAAATPDEVTATCVDSSGTVVSDDYCDDTYASGHGGYSSGGFIYIGGSSYRYNYGGTGTMGSKVSGGSYTKPSGNTNVTTSSGKSVQRGGFGVSGGGKSGGS